MRLSLNEKQTIISSVEQCDKFAKIYLFGSRVDDKKQGGDIDLLIISKQCSRKDLSKIRWDFYDKFGEQKMDIIIDDGSISTPFVKLILPNAQQLR
jgi:predicted nucleotidyltransferase